MEEVEIVEIIYKLIQCNHCSYQGNSENEVLSHSVNAHKGIPARPDFCLNELIEIK